MTYWEILGIEPVDDLPSLKKAYAKKLKVHHPEEDPEGYQRLREAYDALTRELKRGTNQFTPKPAYPMQAEQNEASIYTYEEEHAKAPIELDIYEEKVPVEMYEDENTHAEMYGYEEEAEANAEMYPYEQTEETVEENTVEVLLGQTEQLYGDLTYRIQPSKWIDLLNDPALWDLTVKKEFGLELFDFLMHHPFLPNDVWKLLEENFQWREHYPEFLLEEDEERARFWSYYQKHLGIYPALSFEEITREEHIEADAFLQKRERSLNAFLDSRLQEAKEQAKEAELLFAHDPDLLRLQGEIHFRLREFNEAASFYERYLALKPEDREALLVLARMEYEQKNWKQASALCAKLADSFPQDADVLSLKAKCLLKEQKAGEAFSVFQAIESSYSYDVERMVYSAKIYAYARDLGFKKNRDRALPSSRESKQNLYRSTVMERIGNFARYMYSISAIFFTVLFIISWNGVAETSYGSNPFVFAFIILGSFFVSEVSLDYIDRLAPFLWEAMFILACFFLGRTILRALKAIRY